MEITKELFDEWLKDNSEEEYAKFHKNLVPGDETIRGIRMPKMRAFAKKADYYSLKGICSDTYEERMILGLSLGYSKLRDEEFFKEMDHVTFQFKSWAEVDSFCATVKNREGLFEKLRGYITSGKTYVIRTALSLYLDKFLDDEHIDAVLSDIESLDCTEYYVMMGAAWVMATAYINYPVAVYEMIKSEKPDKKTALKAISKACESYRISDGEKQRLKELRQSLKKN